jgi:hypothetical protein|nr:MAG TPA: hypothetical protein [Caudoviricetes sp.]
MKSGKAKKIIRETDLYISVQGVMFQDSRAMMKKDAIKAVEIAEQEAEERMRKKAIGAFDDMWFENGEDGEFEPDYEYHRRNFIQKLNEDEND